MFVLPAVDFATKIGITTNAMKLPAISKITGYQPEEIFELYIEAKLEETGKRAS